MTARKAQDVAIAAKNMQGASTADIVRFGNECWAAGYEAGKEDGTEAAIEATIAITRGQTVETL
jgi:hypothetical protein